jgi:WD40 repeat protein
MKIELETNGRYSFPMGILDVVFRADEQRAFAACMDGIYSLAIPPRDAKEEKPKPVCIGRHSSYVSGIGLLKDDTELASTAYDGTLQIRTLSTEADQEIAPHIQEKIHSFWSWKAAVSPDRTRIASVSGQYLAGAEDYSPMPSDEPTVKLLEASNGAVLQSFKNMLPPVQCVAFDPSGRYLAAGNLMGDLAVWDIESGKVLAEWRTKSFTSWGIIKSHCYISGIFAVSFSPDGKSLYAAGMGDMRDPMAGNGKQLWQRFAWQSNPVEKIQESLADQTGEGLMETLAWHPSGEHFVMAGRLRGGIWNLGIFAADSGRLIGQAKTGMRITTARFSADGQQLYLAGMQGQPGRKEGSFPDFGYLERYSIITS